MNKPTIAVDIDDVLSATAGAFVAWSNQQWGTNLTVEDYQEHWGDMWQVDLAETERRAGEWFSSGVARTYQRRDQSTAVLTQLSKRFRLIITTSRSKPLRADTHEWLEEHYKGIFEEVHFSGIYDGVLDDRMAVLTKGDLFKSLGVRYAIDDQPKHCVAALEHGAEAILFGDYPWNRGDFPAGVTRCKDWQGVLEYFDERT